MIYDSNKNMYIYFLEFRGIQWKWKDCKWNSCQENNSCQSGWKEIDRRSCGTRKKMLHCCNEANALNG